MNFIFHFATLTNVTSSSLKTIPTAFLESFPASLVCFRSAFSQKCNFINKNLSCANGNSPAICQYILLPCFFRSDKSPMLVVRGLGQNLAFYTRCQQISNIRQLFLASYTIVSMIWKICSTFRFYVSMFRCFEKYVSMIWLLSHTYSEILDGTLNSLTYSSC